MNNKRICIIAFSAIMCMFILAGCASIKDEVKNIAENISNAVQTKTSDEAIIVPENAKVILQESEILSILEQAYPDVTISESSYDMDNCLYNAKLTAKDGSELHIAINAQTGEVVNLSTSTPQDEIKS